MFLAKDAMIWRVEHTCVNHIHSAHGATSIVENPLLVEVHVGLGRGVLEVGDNVGDNRASVVAMLRDCALCKVVQLCWLENVEAFQIRLQESVDAVEHG